MRLTNSRRERPDSAPLRSLILAPLLSDKQNDRSERIGETVEADREGEGSELVSAMIAMGGKISERQMRSGA